MIDCLEEVGTNSEVCDTGATLFESRIFPSFASILGSIIVSNGKGDLFDRVLYQLKDPI